MRIFVDYAKIDEVFGFKSNLKSEWLECESVMSPESNPFYGLKHTESSKKQMSESAKLRPASWKVKQQNRNTIYHYNTPDGKSLVIKGSLNKFCKENGLNTGAMSKVHRGEVSHHKGYTL